MVASADLSHISSQPESVTTLRTIVELVRRITHADVASVVSFSLAEKTITWKAASGFRAHVIDQGHPLVQPITDRIARRAIEADSVGILKGIGIRDDLPAKEFPVHSAEGVRDLALAPLKARGQTLGGLLAGYRAAHHFTSEEQQLLEDLAKLAALTLDNARLLESASASQALGEKIWEETFDAIAEGILVYDRNMRIVRCNARAAEMIGTEPGDVIGFSFSEAFARLFGQGAAAYYLAENRRTVSAFEVQTEDGKRNVVSIFPIVHPDGNSVSVVTLNDVTRLSEMQEQLGRSRRLASVGQLAAGVAHEINNPLAAITTCAEATMRDLRKSSDTWSLAESHQWNFYLEEIVRQTLRCKEITRGLLDLTQQRHAQRVVCDLNSTVKQCAKVALQRADPAIEFKIDLDQSIGEVATDAAMIRQILDNLLSNAIGALENRAGRISVSTKRDGDRIAIEVADTGCGIPADSLARIFDPFYSMKPPGEGYGLGLAISSTLAESLGGAITVKSKEGEGSRFSLWIPRRAPE